MDVLITNRNSRKNVIKFVKSALLRDTCSLPFAVEIIKCAFTAWNFCIYLGNEY